MANLYKSRWISPCQDAITTASSTVITINTPSGATANLFYI